MSKALLILLLASVSLLAACNSRKDDARAFDGVYFKTSAKSVDGDRREFAVNVRKAGLSVSGALQAGAFRGTRYCIDNYGISDKTWHVGPDQDPEDVVLDGDTLVLTGRCDG